MAKGGTAKLEIGDNVHVTEKGNLADGKTGMVTGFTDGGKEVMVTFLNNGNERTVSVMNKNCKLIKEFEDGGSPLGSTKLYEDGGDVDPDYDQFMDSLSDKREKFQDGGQPLGSTKLADEPYQDGGLIKTGSDLPQTVYSAIGDMESSFSLTGKIFVKPVSGGDFEIMDAKGITILIKKDSDKDEKAWYVAAEKRVYNFLANKYEDGGQPLGSTKLYEDGGQPLGSTKLMAEGGTTANKIPNIEASAYSEHRMAFKGHDLEGKVLENGDYLVQAWGYYPLWYYCSTEGKWYENMDRYSNTTSKYKTMSRPTWQAEQVTVQQLFDKMRGNDATYELGGIMVRNLQPMPIDNTLIAEGGGANTHM